MISTSDRRSNGQTRTYDRADSVVFLKTKEAFGGLSNMAGGFPLEVNGIRILTSEALYQACRFPHLPEVQKLIITQTSPMTAKMKSKPHRSNSRPDWDQVRVNIMRWCLRVKLAQNWAKFSKLLLGTGERPIVEESRRDDFWGAKPIDEQTLVGMNVLGRLLMELREEVKSRDRASLIRVEPLGNSDFWLYGQPIQPVEADSIGDVPKTAPRLEKPASPSAPPAKPVQASLFDQTPPNAKTEPRRKEVQQVAGSMDDLKPYPAMRDSGVHWLGEIPEHWEVRRGKTLFRCVDVRSSTGEEELLTVSSSRGVVPRRTAAVTMFKAESYVGHKLCWPGDLVINSLWAWARGLGVSQHHGIVSTAYGVYRPQPKALIDAQYIHELVRSEPFHWELQVRSKGVWTSRLQLTDESFLGAPFPIPPLSEQTAIVRFLDHMDRRIGRAIRAKQKLITLLNEQKQAIIHQAVTRGLDPNVRLKPSGVAWLADVPEHWEVLPLKRRWTVTDCKHLTVPFVEEGFPLASVREVQSFDLCLDNAKRTTVDWYEKLIQGDRAPSQGDLIYCRNVSVGAAAVVSTCERFAMGQDVCLIRSKEQSQRYLNYFLRSPPMRRQLALLLVGSTFDRINVADIKALIIAIPPGSEQHAIVRNLDAELQKFDRGIGDALREISFLREYRTRLIADVVTGKLDVRQAAARLPEEAEEPEPFDEADALEGGDEEAGEANFDEAAEEAVA